MAKPTKPSTPAAPVPAPAPAKTVEAKVQAAKGSQPSAQNCTGVVCPKTAPAPKGMLERFGDAYKERRERILAEQNAKSTGEKISDLVGLIPALRGAGAAGTTSKIKPPSGKATVPAKPPAPSPAPATTAPPAPSASPKKGDGKNGGHSKGKAKLKCGEGGNYKDLKTKTGDGKFDRDHIPSKSALKERAEQLNKGRELNPQQKKAIDDWGNTIAIPRQAHQDISPTYGGRSNPAADAKDLAGSAQRDVDAMLKKIDEYDADGGCKKAYKKASKKITSMKNSDYDRELKRILSSNK